MPLSQAPPNTQELSTNSREDRARGEEEAFRLLIENGTDIITVLEADGTIRYESPSIQRILGYEQTELVGQHAFDFVHPEDVSRVIGLFAQSVHEPGVAVAVQFRFRHKDGSWRHLEALANNLLHQREIAGVVVNSRDVTERVLNEQRILEQQSRLEAANRCLEEANQNLAEINQKLEAANTQLEALAVTDSLTGVKNHRAFAERFEEEVQRAMRYQAPLSLMILDIDRFKNFNDMFGHQAGDRALKCVAQVLQDNVRNIDFVARYGGEEFVIIMPGTGPHGAVALAENLRSAIEKYSWPEHPITASFGIASVSNVPLAGSRSRRFTSGDELFAEADRALYHSKASGRNLVTHARALEPVEAKSTSSANQTEAGQEATDAQPTTQTLRAK
ncbi:MAG TPA: diguanylate cyclase [Abditibacteriaceae bacterium]|jgi:diguanylate cyclase (GGDEF)-like protein/PAS domain S-box-containing protein